MYRWLTVLLPGLAGLIIDNATADDGAVRIWAHVAAAGARCGRCGQVSARVHSRYVRTLADTVIGGRPAVITLEVRRLFCDNPACAARTFAEQVPDLTVRYARRTTALACALTSIALALSGRAGARLAARLGMTTVSRGMMLRLIRRLPDPAVGVVAVLGVDDFAFRRRYRYGTILIDMDTNRPVDVLPDRQADTFAAWLKAHPGTAVICRDRAGAYAAGARDGAPDAIQVADRWHVWHNLGEAVEKTVTAHHACLREPADDTDTAGGATGDAGADPTCDATTDPASARRAAEPADTRLVARTKQRYAAVQSLLRQGFSKSRVARELHLDPHTVRRFAHATSIDQLLAKTTSRGIVLDPFTAHLGRRFTEGETDAAMLYREIRADGYRGSEQTVRRYLRPFRDRKAAPPTTPQPPKVRHLAGWIMTDPEHLEPDDQVKLKDARSRCPHLEALAGHVAEFAKMLTGLHGEMLDAWIQRVDADDLPAMHTFTAGLKNDRAAVLNGLTLPYNSGPVEGNVNRIKTIKRQMYGRAKFDLLRKRILLSA